jgi:alpha,alpha-trehalose phosphorylase
MFIPFDEELGINPQDSEFVQLEPWDWETTPPGDFPLLLHYHPLVIYRHQVLKQADVVLAMFLRSERFPVDQKRRNFDFYDPITTGDSSLSSCVQAVVAAEVGYDELAIEYFTRSLYLDLCDSHGNTADGVHVANAGGVWAGIVNGFAGMVEQGNHLVFSPRLPSDWDGITFRLQRHDSTLQVDLDPDGLTLTALAGSGVPVLVGDDDVVLVTVDEPLRIDR